MVLLFLFEFIEGNTITRRYFMRLRRLTRQALQEGAVSPDLRALRAAPLPTFTHFLDLPILMLIVSLGAMRPERWTHFLVGSALALIVAGTLTAALPRLYPSDPAIGPKARLF